MPTRCGRSCSAVKAPTCTYTHASTETPSTILACASRIMTNGPTIEVETDSHARHVLHHSQTVPCSWTDMAGCAASNVPSILCEHGRAQQLNKGAQFESAYRPLWRAMNVPWTACMHLRSSRFRSCSPSRDTHLSTAHDGKNCENSGL